MAQFVPMLLLKKSEELAQFGPMQEFAIKKNQKKNDNSPKAQWKVRIHNFHMKEKRY